MVNYNALKFKNFNQYKEYFFNTLLPSNKTFQYFVDWEKVKYAVKKHLNEISLLNSLTKINYNEREKHLFKLINNYPKIAKVIPILIAERVNNGNLDIFDNENEEIITFNFNKNYFSNKEIKKLIAFCKKTGILELFNEIKDIYDYLIGVEVGLDSNTRKNRSGKIFEEMVQKKIKDMLNDKFVIKNNDKSFSLYPIVKKNKKRGKTHDIVIYSPERKTPILIVECNYYNVSGSKPSSIAESYPEMYRVAKTKGIEFLWVTDGPAWIKMEESITRAMNEIEWLLNYQMLKKYFPIIIKEISLNKRQ